MRSISSSPRSGPSAIAIAAALLRSTTGDGAMRARARRTGATICGQSVVSCSVCRAAIAACSWYGPARRSRSARSTSSRPSAISPASQRERSWSSSSTSAPSASSRASRRESCSSISARRPSASGSSGISAGEHPRRGGSPRRRGRCRARRIPLVEDEVDDGEHGREPLGQEVVRRHAERDAGRADLPLRPHEPLRHRLLADEERSRDLAGVRPPSRRSVSATCASARERRVAAREDQRAVARRGIVPPSLPPRRPGGRRRLAARPRRFPASVRSRRSRSIARLRAVVTIQPTVLAGTPSRGQRSTATRTRPEPRPRRGRRRRWRGRGPRLRGPSARGTPPRSRYEDERATVNRHQSGSA